MATESTDVPDAFEVVADVGADREGRRVTSEPGYFSQVKSATSLFDNGVHV